ncbi:MAG: Cyclohexadienyl dehydrogenase [Anaerolineales bacterium]|nr:Cyclohexadienyl dehydrogenase [Anaerolineales bacterium]
MSNDFSLAHSNVAILGLGLMGGSLALALRGHCASLLGADPHPAALEAARSRAIVDRLSADPASLLPEADVIILAAPVPAIEALLENLSAWTSHPCVVLDIGSTKRTIVEAMSRLPAHFDPIGGHPICGKETLTLAHAEAALYRGATFCLVPLARSGARARSIAQQILKAIGAQPLIVEAGEHDRILAVTSHLPFLLSSALTLSACGEARPFIGPGFRSTSRLAGTPASMMSGALRANRDHLLAALAGFRARLTELESALAARDDAALTSLLERTRASYLELMSAPGDLHKTGATR